MVFLFSRQIHGALYLLAPLLARLGRADLGNSGGCQIGDSASAGARPVNHIVSVLQAFGASCRQTDGRMYLTLPTGRFRGTRINIRDYYGLQIPGPLTSGATQTAILAAATAEGVSEIANPYRKPDVTELLAFLSSAGVAIQYDNKLITIQGAGGPIKPTTFSIVSDVMEIFTFATCAAYLDTPLRLTNVTPRARQGLVCEIELLEALGIQLTWGASDVLARQIAPSRGGLDIHVTNRSIYSDNHPFFTLLLCLAREPSRIREEVWVERFDYARQLAKLGARLTVRNAEVFIEPGRPSKGGECVVGNDLRSAAVLLVTALGIRGQTTVRGAEHLARGYEDLVGKLRRLGASIDVV